MIFVTVGTQLAFDRLISAVDAWASRDPGREIFAQVGPSRLRPRYLEYAQRISPEQCIDLMRGADAIVAHAGMGTILTALELGKPVVVMPRRASLGEHRNDHQVATARRLAEQGRVKVAFDERELPIQLDELNQLAAQPPISRYAPDDFVAALRAFIDGKPLSTTPGAVNLLHT